MYCGVASVQVIVISGTELHVFNVSALLLMAGRECYHVCFLITMICESFSTLWRMQYTLHNFHEHVTAFRLYLLFSLLPFSIFPWFPAANQACLPSISTEPNQKNQLRLFTILRCYKSLLTLSTYQISLKQEFWNCNLRAATDFIAHIIHFELK